MVKMNEFTKHQATDLNYLLNMTNVEKQRRSRRLGMASMGNPCTRAMWMQFRWARITELNRRVRRIFLFGDSCEDLIINELREIGLTVTREQEPVEGWGGHIYGFIDGVVTGVPEAPVTEHLFEAKSANDRIFKMIQKKGVKAGKFEHYAQMQNYMGKLKLKRALYVIINKNTSEIWTCRIKFDQADYNEIMSRGIDVVASEEMPPNLLRDENAQACKFCNFSPICYGDQVMLKSCRSCTKVDLEEDGKWSCSLKYKVLSIEDQEAACDNYRPIGVNK